jgi:DNA-binding NarL/FixJ family response regulator
MITLILADDHKVTRTGIKTILELDQKSKWLKRYLMAKELLDYLSECTQVPDTLLLDLEMPILDGPKVINILHEKYPTLKTIIFSFLHETDIVMNMITKGASGFISKSEDPDNIAIAIKEVYYNGYYLGELVKKDYFKIAMAPKSKEGFAGRQILSAREVEFIKLAASNLTYPEIAANNECEFKNLRKLQSSLFQKLEFKNRAAMIVYGIRNGIIHASGE